MHGRSHYGLRMAAFLPYVLLHPRWQLRADTRWDGARRTLRLSDDQGLVSPLRPSPAFDSILEREFAARFAALGSDWELVREMGLEALDPSIERNRRLQDTLRGGPPIAV